MSTEALKAKKMYADAAVEFIKLTNEVRSLLHILREFCLRLKAADSRKMLQIARAA